MIKNVIDLFKHNKLHSYFKLLESIYIYLRPTTKTEKKRKTHVPKYPETSNIFGQLKKKTSKSIQHS